MSLFPAGETNSALISSRDNISPSITLLGTSHNTANVDFRERFSDKLKGFHNVALAAGLGEFSILQTCNRVELYCSTGAGRGAYPIVDSLGYKTLKGFYVKNNLDVVIHLFSVASGLDSVALGEGQISRQVRAAGRQARTAGNAKSILTPLFEAAYTSSVRVRRRHRVGLKGLSLSEIALRFALGRLGAVPSNVLIAGTGETARIAALELKGARIHLLTSRRGGGKLIPGSVRVTRKALPKVIAKCELVVCATKHAGYVISRKDIPTMGRRVMLDLGFPRNIDPSVRSLRSVELVDLDDVAPVTSQDNGSMKLAPAQKAVEAEAIRFYAWLTATRLNPALASIYKWAERVRDYETSAALRRLPKLSEQERRVVEVMSRRLVSKLMAPHAEFAKGDSSPEDQETKLRLLERIFPVDEVA